MDNVEAVKHCLEQGLSLSMEIPEDGDVFNRYAIVTPESYDVQCENDVTLHFGGDALAAADYFLSGDCPEDEPDEDE